MSRARKDRINIEVQTIEENWLTEEDMKGMTDHQFVELIDRKH